MFPNILYKSIFLHIYAVVESSLVEICRNLIKVLELDIKVQDFSGKGITQYEKCLKKGIKIDFPSSSETWICIADYSKIRNVLIHSDGVLPKTNNEFTILMKKHKGISIDSLDEEFNYLTLKKEFILEAIENVRNFFYILQDKMKALK